MSLETRFAPFVSLLCLLLASLPGAFASAQSCGHGQCTVSPCHTPAYGAPPSLWDELEARDAGALAPLRDSTDFNEQTGNWSLNAYFMSLDVEQGWVFMAANRRFQIWDARNQPQNPVMVANQERSQMGLTWQPASHVFFVFEDVDAPPGDSNVVAVAAGYGIGLAVFDTAVKHSPVVKYQDHGDGRWAREVYATQIGQRQYAFLAADQQGGLFAYDLTAVRAMPQSCVEAQPGASTPCAGVFVGRVGGRTSVRYVDGAGNYLAFSSGTSPYGVEVWRVSQPAAPVRVINGLTNESVYGVALWEEGASTYLAATMATELRIYDVSCIRSGPCSLGAPLWSAPKPFAAETLTFSRSNGIPFLYLAGGTSDCLEGAQNEWLYDVRVPAAPREISPKHHVSINGEAVSYWGWYYRRNGVHGFNHVAPKAAKFYGTDLFRAAKGIFDVHRRVEGVDTPFFADGFESGGFGAWDSVLP